LRSQHHIVWHIGTRVSEDPSAYIIIYTCILILTSTIYNIQQELTENKVITLLIVSYYVIKSAVNASRRCFVSRSQDGNSCQ
jgi:hypothetical protein